MHYSKLSIWRKVNEKFLFIATNMEVRNQGDKLAVFVHV